MANTQYLTLIDYVPLHVALASPPGSGLWTVVATTRKDGTGSATSQVAVIHRGTTDILNFQGPTMLSLGDKQLEEESERMRRIIAAAQQALHDIEEHLAFRRRL